MDCLIADQSWGPWAGPSCRGGLDFTLFFEESMFSILPTGLLIIAAALQVAYLYGRPRQTGNGLLLPVKLVCDTPLSANTSKLMLIFNRL